jgi:hypothetical protein
MVEEEKVGKKRDGWTIVIGDASLHFDVLTTTFHQSYIKRFIEGSPN